MRQEDIAEMTSGRHAVPLQREALEIKPAACAGCTARACLPAHLSLKVQRKDLRCGEKALILE